MSAATLATDTATPLLSERVRGVFQHLPKALVGDEEAIHQMRVAGRRLRVALPLLARKPEGKGARRCQRRLRELTRTAGTSRDLDVILGLFEQRLVEGGKRSRESALLLRRLRDARRRSRQRMVEALLDIKIAGLRRELRAVMARRGEGLFGVLLRLRRQRELLGAELLAGFTALGAGYDVEELHERRKAVRRLRYAAEVWDKLRDQKSEAPGLLKKLQEQLGNIHDTHVLSEWLGQQAAAAAARSQRALARDARQHQAFFTDASRAAHRALLERRPAEVVQRAMHAMGGTRSAA